MILKLEKSNLIKIVLQISYPGMDQNFKEEILDFINVLKIEQKGIEELEKELKIKKKRFNESLEEFYKKFSNEDDHCSTSSLPSLMEIELNVKQQSSPLKKMEEIEYETSSKKKKEELFVPEVPRDKEVLGQNKKLVTPSDFKKSPIRITYADAALQPPRLNDFPELQNERKKK